MSKANTKQPSSIKQKKKISNRPPTPREKEYARQLANLSIKDNSKGIKDIQREAYKRAYNVKTTNLNTIDAEASKTTRRPQVQSQLAKYNNLIENTLINTVSEYSSSSVLGKRKLAVDTAQYIHDKIHGKAIQQSTSVNYNFSNQAKQKSQLYDL